MTSAANVAHDFAIAILLVAGSALLPAVDVSSQATSLSGDWTLSLNGSPADEILVALDGPPVRALCSAPDLRTFYTFTWTTGEGTCLNASRPLAGGGAGSIHPPQNGYSAAVEVAVAGLSVARYYFVKCSAVRLTSTVSQCSQFRLYSRTGAGGSQSLDAVADGAAVLLPCGTLVLPADVAVDVAWTRAGKPLPAERQQTSTVQSGSNATSAVTSSLLLRNSPDTGGLYTCTAKSSVYGRLVEQTVAVYRAAAAFFIALDERTVSSQAGKKPTILVSATCEGYGYPLPSVSLIKDQFTFSGNSSIQQLEGGIRATYEFSQSRADDASEVSSYGCRAVNERGASTVYYNAPPAVPPATMAVAAAAASPTAARAAERTPASPTVSSSSSAQGPAAFSGGTTWLRRLPASWSLALVAGFILSSACLS